MEELPKAGAPKAEVTVSVDADTLPTPMKDALAPATAAPPVPAQRTSHVNAAKLESEKVVLAAPLSYAGSAARIWKLTGITDNAPARVALGVAALILIIGAWCFVTAWYLVWGLLLVPYRLMRRGSRKRKRENLQHRELLTAVSASRSDDSAPAS
jgi:hypothetical protein